MIGVAERWRSLAGGTATLLRRFPLPLAAGLVGAIAGGIFARDGLATDDGEVAWRVLLVAWLGIPLFLTSSLVGSRRGRAWTVIMSATVVLLLAVCYAGLRGRDDWTKIRFALFALAAHAMLAVTPLACTPRGDFRPFNLMLFARTTLGLALTQLLFAGLSFALKAVEHLFDVQISDRVYPQLWFALMGVFNTAYVLAGIPADWERLEGRVATPLPLEVLARFGLLPLSVLYLAILYVYSVKILVVHQWPRGWVSAPIIVFAAIGMLTVLLLDPERLARGRVARAYGRGFFVALMPLVVLLFLAISRRVFEYGLTEERCLVYAVAVFLAVIAPYFVLSRTRHLWAIPLVLALLSMTTAVGPLSARSLAVRSQTARLRGLLERNGLLVQGALTRGQHAIPDRDEREIAATLSYLETRQALAPVLAWHPSMPCSNCNTFARATTAQELTDALGLSYRPWHGDERMSHLSAPIPEVLDPTGFTVVFPAISCSRNGLCSHDYTWRLSLNDTTLNAADQNHTIDIPLAPLEQIAQASGDQGLRIKEPLIREGYIKGAHYRLYISSITFHHTDEDAPPQITYLTGVLLLHPN